MEDFKRALCDGIHGALVGAQEKGSDSLVTRTLVFTIIGRWFEDHPGLEDHTVKCSTCCLPTTKKNRIESSDNSDTPKYLCERCCNDAKRPSGTPRAYDPLQREIFFGLSDYLGV